MDLLYLLLLRTRTSRVQFRGRVRTVASASGFTLEGL